MPNYVLPQVLVFQEFNASPAILTQPLRACIVGEHFSLHRYTNPDEKPATRVLDDVGGLVSYDPLGTHCYLWPHRGAGEVVDQNYSRVFFENALLQYYHEPIGSGSSVNWTGPGKNRVRAANRVFQTANGYSRESVLLRDVKLGDIVQLAAHACGSEQAFQSTVIGFAADVIAAVISAAQVEVSNSPTQTLLATPSQTAGLDNNVNLSSVTGSAYNGLPDGSINETYTIDVVSQSVGADATTAVLRLTSASGLDNVSSFSPAAFGAPTTVGARGLTFTFVSSAGDNFTIGQQWQITMRQAFTMPAVISGGAYIGTSNLTYIVKVTTGGKFADSVKPIITVSTNTGQDLSGPTTVTASGDWIPVGNYGVTIKFTGAALCEGDRYYIPVVAEKAGAVRTLVLAENVPDALRGDCVFSHSSSSVGAAPDLDLVLCIKKNIELPSNRIGSAPLTNWTQSETQVCLNAGITATDTSWFNPISGALVPLPVIDGAVYAHYRGRLGTWSNTLGTVTSDTAVPAALGTVDPDNPLAYGVYKATLNANGEEVKFLGVHGKSTLELTDWLKTLAFLTGREDVYSLVPLTQDLDVIEAFVGLCNSESTPQNGRWKIGFYNRAAIETQGVYVAVPSGDPILGVIQDDPDTTGLQYTILESVGAKFMTNGVVATDIIRTNYVSDGFGNFTWSEYEVDEVINEETIRLLTGPSAPINVAQKFEVWRTYNMDQLAANLATFPGLISSRRANLIWPDKVGDNGVTVPGYFLAAAIAGLASGVLPHQGLTNVEIIGFDDLTRTTNLFNATQLNTMAASGYWIVTRDPNNGMVYSRHELTCGDQSDVNQRENSITRNVDQISYIILFAFRPYIGRANVTAVLIDTLYGQLISILNAFQFTILSKLLGPQLNAYTITTLQQSPLAKDRVQAVIQIVPPAPFNNLELHLQVS